MPRRILKFRGKPPMEIAVSPMVRREIELEVTYEDQKAFLVLNDRQWIRVIHEIQAAMKEKP